jgi:adenylosuccinate synthase
MKQRGYTWILTGLYYGDEGKGKIVDFLAEKVNVVVRFQGGANAGHTLVSQGKKTILRLTPSGIMRPNVKCVIGSGVAFDPEIGLKEIKTLVAANIIKDFGQLLISDQASLLLPVHKILDQAREKERVKIGTTGSGIGPSYEDHSSRRGLILSDLYASDLPAKVDNLLAEKNCLLKHYYGLPPVKTDDLLEWLEPFRTDLAPFRLPNLPQFVDENLSSGQDFLFEGAQGAFLDTWNGTYPFVTSSATTAGSACATSGFGPSDVDLIIGVAKAYSTRVGEGPFVAEEANDIGEWLRRQGQEFGSATGRPRRCGWIDLPALKQAVRMNGTTHVALTKLDVLSGAKEIKAVVDYEYQGKKLSYYPTNLEIMRELKPIYKIFPGWSEDISICGSFRSLPRAAKNYVRFIEDYLNVPISLIGVGPDRSHIIDRGF